MEPKSIGDYVWLHKTLNCYKQASFSFFMDIAALNFTKPISRYFSIVSDKQRMFSANFSIVDQILGCSYSLKFHILAKIGPFLSFDRKSVW